MFTVYLYQKCSTCRDALQWLVARGIPCEIRAIRETPPSIEELKAALELTGGNIRKLLNTSGMDYRELGMKDKLATMTEGEVLDLMSRNGNLVKRPFLIGDGIALAGFKPDVWERTLVPG